MLDIEALRLTDEELHRWLEDRLGEHYRFNKDFCHGLADAQLAKVLWGIADWLEPMFPTKERVERTAENINCQLRAILQVTGVTRPEDGE